MPRTIQRVLIYRLGSLGDHVVALPCLHLVARAFPDAERRMLTNVPISAKAPAAAAVLGDAGLVHAYFRYAVGARDVFGLLGLWLRILLWRPQALVYLTAARSVAVARRDRRFFQLCGIAARDQFGVPLTDDLQQNRPQGELWEPEAARLARTIAPLGDARLDDAASWDLHLTAAEEAAATSALARLEGMPFVAVSLGTKIQVNDWGHEHWAALLTRRGASLRGYALVMNGVAEERAASEAVAAGWAGPVLNLCGQMTPRQSAAVFQQAQVYVGHDSGPMHLAAAMQTPCVAIFSARQRPGVWFPYGRAHRVLYHRVSCWNCGLETCVVEGKRCILSVAVEEVLGAVLGVLEANAEADSLRE